MPHCCSKQEGRAEEKGKGDGGKGSKASLISLKREVTSFMQGRLAMIPLQRENGSLATLLLLCKSNKEG
jgi:hypothetical protein